MFSWILLAELLQLSMAAHLTNPVILTNYGCVEGTWKTTTNEGTYAAFTGIPFAKPPTGQLRFANPERPEKWCGVFDATRYAPRCIQENYIFWDNPSIEGSEDCLYLNVYVPANMTRRLGELQLPVMVGIHWGGFFAGGSDAGYLDPVHFMDHGVIVVTFNYRLGIFGLLSTLDDASPGNYALKDQVLALKWVQENIRNFGGVPENVTIFGQSAGAASVHLHYISDASNGLFSKGISQSGTALADWAYPNNPLQWFVTNTQAQLMNCSLGTSLEIVNCLRIVPPEVLLRSQEKFKFFHRYPFSVWSLVTENKTETNPEPFLTHSIYDALESGNFKRLPWMVGAVRNEGLLVAASLMTVQSETDDLNRSFNDTMKKLLGLTIPDSEDTYEMVYRYYLNRKSFLNWSDPVWTQNFINVFTDRYFNFPLYESVRMQVDNKHDSIYMYSFEYSGEYTYAQLFSTEPSRYALNLGSSHCDDLLYQYRSPALFDDLKEPTDRNLMTIWLKLWTTFAKHGKPNPASDPVLPKIDWKPLTPKDGFLRNCDVMLLNVTGSYQTGPNFEITQGFYRVRILHWVGYCFGFCIV